MNRLFVRCLIWFFIAALPMQGFAAMAKTCCAPNQPGTAHQHIRHEATYGWSAHAIDSAVADAHCAAMAKVAIRDPDCPAGDGACSACAACWFAVAVAPPAEMSLHRAMINAATIAPASILLPAGHIPGGLERPPRVFLA